MKKRLLNELINKLKEELHNLEIAAKANKDFATDQEFKAESKYDTRSLEASYLASAESMRVEDLKMEIQLLEEIDLDATNKAGEVCIGSLVELKHQDQSRSYFLIPVSGGTFVKMDDLAIMVVSVFSPLGSAVLGLKQGDAFEVETPKETRTYEVVDFL